METKPVKKTRPFYATLALVAIIMFSLFGFLFFREMGRLSSLTSVSTLPEQTLTISKFDKQELREKQLENQYTQTLVITTDAVASYIMDNKAIN
ncbi:hypothetical protein [Eubacterium sp. 1001713B170207_170306_E7]|uniref:hypothetical protein n=1 Tax=Eubacterium sp. 1001713B170207_170306_E7 TaxID=2787097 RepID=UPI001899734C|nr:hypothetical protein [Eubacterium sp. 1001713B170207_170306_E7]